jgi:hypothetical protein
MDTMSTTTDLTEGQTFTPTEGKFAGRTMTVKTIGSTGRTLIAIEQGTEKKIILTRTLNPLTVRIED